MTDARGQTEFGKLQEDVRQAKSIAQQRDQDWKDLYDYYEGEGQKKAFDFSGQEDWVKEELRIANLVYSIVRTNLPILLDAAPIWFVVDEEANPQEEITDYMQAYFHRRRVRSELRMVLRDALVMGTGCVKIWYDKRLGAHGDAAVTWQDPFCVFTDPAADRLEDAEFVAILNEYSEGQAKEIFRGTKESPYKRINYDTATKSEVTADSRPRREARSADMKPLIEVWEVYHDFGRKLTIYTGDQQLYSGDNPLGERWPIVFFEPDPNPRAMYGDADIVQLEDIQNDINLLRLRFNINARLVANPQIAIWGGANVEASNEPGHVYKFNETPQDAGIERLAGPSLPSDLWNMMEMNREALDIVSGVQNVTRGRREPGVQAGVAIQALQQAGLTRPREISRDIAAAFELVGQILLEVMQANYEEPRLLSYMTQEGVKVGHVEPDHLSVPGAEGGERHGFLSRLWRGSGGEVRSPRPLRVVVQTGGDMPLGQAQRADQAVRLSSVQLTANSAIDRRALLEELNFPNRQQVADRMEEAEAAMMQAQAGAPQGGMAPEGPVMEPEQAIEILQQILEPEDLVKLSEIRETIALQGQVSDEQKMFLEALMDEPMIAQAIEVYLTAEVVAEGAPQEGPPLTNSGDVF